ncbi:sulfotransferase 1A1-like [Mytilus galloprovincialis]|uniref:sulfotransferase 1A1-like n=1 Tax=Mytilus galloprovincialis TaxID=29158 RepID=UPI003F7C5B29
MEKPQKGNYEFGPITEKDVVVSIKQPGNADTEVLIVEEQEIRLSFQKKGVVPDPRILIPAFQEMECYDDDIFICAYPKCGTHWVWEMCQMIIKGKAEYHSKAKESCMIEFHLPEEYKDEPRPRIFNTHFTPVCLPKQAVEKKSKFILLHRNPKDIVTSLYHHMIKTKFNVDSETTWNQFLQYILQNDREVSSNWFFYNKKWAEFTASNDLDVLVMNYEDLKIDTVSCLSKLADFIGYPRDEKMLQEISEKCTVNKMRDAEKERDSGTVVVNSEQISFLYRKGVVGDWKNQFTVAENEQFDAHLKENMNGDQLNFKYEI